MFPTINTTKTTTNIENNITSTTTTTTGKPSCLIHIKESMNVKQTLKTFVLTEEKCVTERERERDWSCCQGSVILEGTGKKDSLGCHIISFAAPQVLLERLRRTVSHSLLLS